MSICVIVLSSPDSLNGLFWSLSVRLSECVNFFTFMTSSTEPLSQYNQTWHKEFFYKRNLRLLKWRVTPFYTCKEKWKRVVCNLLEFYLKKKNLKKKTTKQFGPKNCNLCRNILRLCKFKFVHIMITGRVTLGSENMETNEKK